MIILGAVLLIIAWILKDAAIPVPPPVLVVLDDVGWVLVVVGLILLLLSFFGIGFQRTWGPTVRGHRYWF